MSKSSLKVCDHVPLFSPLPLAERVASSCFLLTQLLHQDSLPSSHSLGNARDPSRCAIVVFESFYWWSCADFSGFGTIANHSTAAYLQQRFGTQQACTFLCLGVAAGRWRGALHGGSLCVLPRSSPHTQITEEVLAKLWSFIRTQKFFWRGTS